MTLQRRVPLERKTPLKPGTPSVRRTPLPLVSRKRARENRERTKLLKRMAADGRPLCVVPGPSHYADDGHEVLTRARGGSITDPANVVPICRAHHERVGSDKTWAESLGLLKPSWENKK